MTITTSSTSTGTQAVDRAAQLLTLVVEADGPISFTELVEDSGLARSTTSRLLAALESNHLLERDARGAFRSGALFALYAARHDAWSQVARLAAPILRQVGDETNETVNLAIPRGGSVVMIAQVDSSFLLSARDWMHVSVPAHCSAMGKIFFAFDAMAIPVGELEQLTPRSLGSAAALERQLATVRRLGYAVTRGELEIGLDAVAVPVYGTEEAGHPVIAALGVSGPSARIGRNLDEIGRQLSDHALSVAKLLRPRERSMRKKGVA